jgi:protein involved in polysaccharide export with SLBB domain
MKHRVFVGIVCFFLSVSPALMGQIQTQIALSNPNYPVTAGDIYTLTFMVNNSPVTYTITVDNSYMIRVANLGLINVAGKTYQQLKRDVEGIVTNNYPLSGVQVNLTEPGLFTVYVTGEVVYPAERTTWAMGRLSSVLHGILSVYSSKRNIKITSITGQVRTYDLFKAQRSGTLTQDPYLRPGDVITVSHVNRMVFIYGEVNLPEFYELLPGENLKELIEVYAGGFTPMADVSRIALTRTSEDGWDAAEKI